MTDEAKITRMALDWLARKGYKITPPAGPNSPKTRLCVVGGYVYEVTRAADGVVTKVVERRTLWALDMHKPMSAVTLNAVEQTK